MPQASSSPWSRVSRRVVRCGCSLPAVWGLGEEVLLWVKDSGSGRIAAATVAAVLRAGVASSVRLPGPGTRGRVAVREA